jgi:hypothetical protein
MRLPPSCARLAVACFLAAFVSTAPADPIITEFLADNVAGITDEDGAHSDWIEIHNPAAAAVNLDGWFLTDDSSTLNRWRFPAVTVPAGGFLVVWASGKDRRVPGSPLHTNFSLKDQGEYLALVRPDGLTVQQEFAPKFPSQDPDRSYGVNFNGTPLLSEGAALSYAVPADGSGGTNWTQPGFTPGAGWTSGFTGAGYGILVPGITARDVHKSTASLGSLAEVDALLALPAGNAGISLERTVITQTVNFFHDGGDGHYAGNLVFPAGGGDYFAVKCTGFIQITAAQAGTWSFGLNSDDGGRIRIDGTDDMVDNTLHGPGDHFGSRALTAGLHSFEVVFWEQGGGSELEFFAAPGALSAWSAAFKLVGDTANGGLQAFTYPAGVSAGSGGFVRTDLQAAMNGVNTTVYLRVPFNVPNPAAVGSLQLGMRYNDGFVAWLNGTEVARRNAPGTAQWNSTATATRTTEQSIAVEPVNLTPFLSALTTGTNVLAIQGLNAGVSDGTFFLLPEMTAGTTLGAGPSVYFNAPTPGAINGQASSLGKVEDTTFSVKRGFYTDPFSLTITTATPDAVIRYTTNGDTPTATIGTIYSGPINITGTTSLRAAAFKSGWDSTNVDTQTYIFINDVVLQSSTTTPPGWPAAAVNGQVYNYGMDPEIVNSINPQIGGVQQVKDALMAIPSFSLVMDQATLTSASGIYSNPGGRGFAWERACSLELLNDDPANGGGFQINGGVRVRGGYSRDGNNPKHGFHFFFRRDYGPAKLNYPLHGDQGTSEFDTFDLRTSENYSWSYGGDGNNTFLREEFTRLTQGAMGSPYSRCRYFHLYINGQYWGLYDTDERPEEGHAEAYFGGSQDDYDVVKSTGSPGGYSTELTHGTLTAWQSLWNQSMAMRTDPSNDRYFKLQGLAADGVTKLNDPAFPRLLDVDNQIDYMLLVFEVASSDAPLTGGGDSVNNWFAYRKRDSDMGFLHFAHDMEHSSFGGDRTGPYTSANTTNFNYANPQFIHQNILGNAEYKMRWADRVYHHMFNDGALTAAANQARITAMAQVVGNAIIAESARWGDSKVEPPKTKVDWQNAKNSLLSFYTSRNTDVLNQLRGDGLYPSINAPGMSQWGGYIASTLQLFLTAATGTIYYTTDGSDPRLIGGALNPAAQIFTSATSSDDFILMGSAGTLVPWKYLVTTTDQGAAWRGTPGFAETGWLTGNTEMGYGDADEVTPIEDNATPGVPATASDRNITTYFRKSFTVNNPAQYSGFTINLLRDDGAVVYINGTEIARPNMPALPTAITWSTLALASNENTLDTIPVPASVIVNGTNIIAVEIHQNLATSSDISFNCSISGTKTNAATPLYLTPQGAKNVKARALSGTTWSALADTTFFVDTQPATAGNLAITEVMYHPGDPSAAEIAAGFNDSGDFEYIELTNLSSTLSADLAGVRFLMGIGFTFSNAVTGRLVPPGGRILLVKNRAAFELRYGTGLPIAGEFYGSLDNSGERLQLVSSTGAILSDFTFADANPWPQQADGPGYSLVLRNPAALPDPSLPQNWRASAGNAGNPGTSDSTSYPAWKTANSVASDTNDDDQDGLNNFTEYATGGSLTESSQARLPVAALETIVVNSAPVVFQTITAARRAGADDVQFIAESSAALTGWSSSGLVFVRSAMNADGTESLTWRSAQPWGSGPRELMRIRMVLGQ